MLVASDDWHSVSLTRSCEIGHQNGTFMLICCDAQSCWTQVNLVSSLMKFH